VYAERSTAAHLTATPSSAICASSRVMTTGVDTSNGEARVA
jgi:hypothetical protein